MNPIVLQKTYVQKVALADWAKHNISVDVLRLDVIHPIISGNKWFKLKFYLQEALDQNKKTIITFGGAYSNHIVATAAGAQAFGLNSIGIIRGEKPTDYSPTLLQAQEFGMQLLFQDRITYRTKLLPKSLAESHQLKESYLINEGGYGLQGMAGAETILQECATAQYTHVLGAAGTGTMLAGLIAGTQVSQECIGISVLKNNFSIKDEIKALLPLPKDFIILHEYHFGGYAKKNNELFQFMNKWYVQTEIPTDFVYTGKVFFALNDLIIKNYFAPNSKLLVVHSGGLQGNRSLPKGTLIFPSN
ncbi:MAG: pyridoxal-phosphate dependent enzyme [Chitinophagaceae bacterium]